MNDWAIIVVVYATLFIASPLITILHELGHAFAYLIFTKPGKVDIYIGSYGSATNTIKFSIGKLNFFIKRSFPFVKGIGLCASDKQDSNYVNRIIILLAGPFFTLFAAALISIVLLNTDPGILINISCYVFLGLSVLSLFGNLVPRRITTSNGSQLNTDGKQILLTLKIKHALPAYVEALEYLQKKEYRSALIKLEIVLNAAPLSEDILRLMIVTALNAKQYDEAALYMSQFESKFQPSASDLFYKGCLLSFTKKHHEAIQEYSKVLKKDRKNLLALNNIGHALIEMGAHAVAAQALEKAIKLNPKFDHPYGNLGHSKILQGDLEGGKALIDQCLSLNINNANAYVSLAIYYLEHGNTPLAATNYAKALELDNDIDAGIYDDRLKALIENHTLQA